jgi:hypothetical protein
MVAKTYADQSGDAYDAALMQSLDDHASLFRGIGRNDEAREAEMKAAALRRARYADQIGKLTSAASRAGSAP